jgi:hypothetical protein
LDLNPHGNFGPFLARSVALLGGFFAKKERKDFAEQKFVYNFYSIHFSVGPVWIIASPSDKKGPTFP